MAAGHVVLSPRQAVVKGIVQVLGCKIAISFASAELVGEKKVLRDGVRLVPCPFLAFLVRTPGCSVLYGVAGKVRQGGIGRSIENGKGIGVGCVPVGIYEAAHQLVIAVGWEAILGVIVA